MEKMKLPAVPELALIPIERRSLPEAVADTASIHANIMTAIFFFIAFPSLSFVPCSFNTTLYNRRSGYTLFMRRHFDFLYIYFLKITLLYMPNRMVNCL